MEEDLDDIGIKTRNVVIHMECYGESSWVNSLGEVWPTQSVDQWVDYLTNLPSGEEVPNIDWIIAVFPGTNKNNGSSDPGIRSWAEPVKAMKYLLKNRCNLKGSLVFFPTVRQMV